MDGARITWILDYHYLYILIVESGPELNSGLWILIRRDPDTGGANFSNKNRKNTRKMVKKLQVYAILSSIFSDFWAI